MAFLDENMLERINLEAKDVRIGHAMLVLVAGLLFGFGWLAARAFSALWLICAWSFAAVKVGWQDGRGRRLTSGSR